LKKALSFCSVIAALAGGALCTPPPGTQFHAAVAGPADGKQRVEFNVFLPLRHTNDLDALLERLQTPGSPDYHKWLTPAEFRTRFGPDPADVATVSETLEHYGFKVIQTHSHGIRVAGTVDNVQHAFGVSLGNAASKLGARRLVTEDGLVMPDALQKAGARIIHFAPLQGAKPEVQIASGPVSPDNRQSQFGGYWFDDLKQAYDFPSVEALNGAGRTIAIMAVSDYQEADIKMYFAHESTSAAPVAIPTISRFPVAGGTAFDPNSSLSLEAELDLEQAGGMAPAANLVLVNVYDSSQAALLDGYLTVVEDDFADIVSSSFTFGPEQFFTAQYNGGIDFTSIVQTFDDVFKQGNAEGITFVESSGDDGGDPAPPIEYFTTAPSNPPKYFKFIPSVETFNSSWHVTSVGGTNLRTTYNPPSLESEYIHENAFGDPYVAYDPYATGNLAYGGYWGSGGGKSILFGKPPYQKFIDTGADTRAVPDISMQMGGCPANGLERFCNKVDSYAIAAFAGNFYGVVGTSISAPDFAGVLALKEQHLGGQRLGNVNYDIYSAAADEPNVRGTEHDLFHQEQNGFNGAYNTLPHYRYNMVLGVGTPFVKNFIFAPDLPSAGNPQTGSNP